MTQDLRPDSALSLLKQHFGFDSFRASQKEIIAHTLDGKNSLVIMPTGMGKSLCYQIPAMLSDSLVLVLSPLVALMKDQVDGLRRKGIDAICIHAGITKQQRIAHYLALAQGKHKLLYVTPERFRKAEFLDALASRKVGLLAIDEAHCISEWGHDFRPDYTRLKEICDRLNKPVVMALTATATPEVQADIRRQLHLEADAMPLFHEGVERPNLHLSVCEVHGEQEKLRQIQEQCAGARGSKIVYFALIKTLERFSELLDVKGVPHIVYHGKLSARERTRRQEAFMQGTAPLVLATNAFGLGVDKADIGLIMHAEVTGSLEAYTQEIGRAGRDGKPSECVLLYDQDDLLIQMDFVNWSNPGCDFYEKLHRLLRSRLQEINAQGLSFLREEMVYSGRFDFRVDTALRLFERHGVTDGELDRGQLELHSQSLPERFKDESYQEEKKRRDLVRLQKMVEYARLTTCRKALLNQHFGFDDSESCRNCDNCTPS
jgi:ATP-dependent DNA helicase RecQ